MKLRRRQPSPIIGRRRPATDSAQGRRYAYYSQSHDTSGVPRARREPLPRSRAEVLRYLAQRFGTIMALVAVVALLVSSVQVSMQPRLVEVNDTSVYRLHPDATYIAAAEQQLRSSWTNTNKITINTNAVVAHLKADYPEIADASVALPVFGQRPVLYVQLTRPSLLLIGNDGSAWVLDETGRVLAPASQVDKLDSFQLPSVSDQSGLPLKSGHLALDGDEVKFIEMIVYQLKTAHLTYSRLVLPPASQELDAYVDGQPYFIKFNLHDSGGAQQQAGAAIATLAYMKKQGKVPTSYLDVRLPTRAYYK